MSLAKKIIRTSLIEEGNKQRKFSEESERIKTQMFVAGDTSRVIVDIYDKPVDISRFRSFDPNVRMTYGKYSIRYLPESDVTLKSHYHFRITQDLIHSSLSVANYKHWLYLCKHVPELDWLRRNSTLCEGLFGLALSHPGLHIPFTIDCVRYAKKIKEQDPTITKPFVNFACSKEFEKKHKDLKLVDIPAKCDIINKIKEADKEYESNN